MRAAELLRWGQDDTVRNAAILDLIAAPTACAATTSTSRQPISKQILTSIYRQLNAKDGSPYVYVENEKNDHFLYGLVAPLLARILAVSCPGLLCVVQLPKTELNELKRKREALQDPPRPPPKRKRTSLPIASRNVERQKGSPALENSPESRYEQEKAEKLSMNGTTVTRSDVSAVPTRDTSNSSSDLPQKESPNVTRSSMPEKERIVERRASSESATESLEEMSMRRAPFDASYGEDSAILHLVCNGFDVLTGKVPHTSRNAHDFTLATTGWVQAGIMSPGDDEPGVVMRFSNKRMIPTEGVVVTYVNGSMVLLTVRDPVQALRSLLIAQDTPTVLFAFSILNEGSLEQYFNPSGGQKASVSQPGGSPRTKQVLMKSNIFVVEIGHKGKNKPDAFCEPEVKEKPCQKKSLKGKSSAAGRICKGGNRNGNGSGSGSVSLESVPDKEVAEPEKESYRLVPVKEELGLRKNDSVPQGAPWTKPVTTDKIPNAVPLFVNTLVSHGRVSGRKVENARTKDCCNRSTSETTGRSERAGLIAKGEPRNELKKGGSQLTSRMKGEGEAQNTKKKKELKRKHARKRAAQRRIRDAIEPKLDVKKTKPLEYGAQPATSQEHRSRSRSLLCAAPQSSSNSNLNSVASSQTPLTASQKSVGPYTERVSRSSSPHGALHPYQHPPAHAPLPPQHVGATGVTYAYENVHNVAQTVVGAHQYIDPQVNSYKPYCPIGCEYRRQHDRPVVVQGVYPSQMGFVPMSHDTVLPNRALSVPQLQPGEYHAVPQIAHSQYAGRAGGPVCTVEAYSLPPSYPYPVYQVPSSIVRGNPESDGALEALMQMGEARGGTSTTAMQHVYPKYDAPATSSMTPSLRTKETGTSSRTDCGDAGPSHSMSNASSKRRPGS